MKAAIIALALVVVATASPQGIGLGGGRALGGGSALGRDPRFINWGPKAYGPGLRNNLAIPVNPFFMRRALQIVNRVPGTLARVETNGEITITDQFGNEAEYFGQDLSEAL